MAHRVPITVRLESFEGPLDLLLYLIQSHELDITRVSIGAITDQYLAYVRLMQELNFDMASEFLVMAATLLHWKSKSLLPQEQKAGDQAGAEDDAFSQEDLIRQLLEHQRFLAAGQDLAQLPLLGEDVYTRPNRRPPVEKVWKEMSITSLATSYQDMLVRARRRVTVLKKETVSITDKIQEFGSKLKVGKLMDLSELVTIAGARPEIVVTFLASLELSRLKKLRVHQEVTYGPILLELLQSLKDFDPTLAIGFDSPIQQVERAMQEQPEAPVPALEIPEDVREAMPSPELLAAQAAPETLTN